MKGHYSIYPGDRGVFQASSRHSREGGNPEKQVSKSLDTRLRGHDSGNPPIPHISRNQH